MADQVLLLEPNNEKASLRKAYALIEETEFEAAERILKGIEESAQTRQDQAVLSEVARHKQRIAKFYKAQEAFSKKIFQNK